MPFFFRRLRFSITPLIFCRRHDDAAIISIFRISLQAADACQPSPLMMPRRQTPPSAAAIFSLRHDTPTIFSPRLRRRRQRRYAFSHAAMPDFRRFHISPTFLRRRHFMHFRTPRR